MSWVKKFSLSQKFQYGTILPTIPGLAWVEFAQYVLNRWKVNFPPMNRPSWDEFWGLGCSAQVRNGDLGAVWWRWMMFLLDCDESQHDDGRTPAFPCCTFHLFSGWMEARIMTVFCEEFPISLKHAYLLACSVGRSAGLPSPTIFAHK